MPGASPRATLDNPYGPLVTFRTEDVLPPSAFYISMNDTVVALFECFAGQGAYTMTTRILMPDGTIQVETYTSQNTPNPNVPWIILPPVEGYLLSLVVNADATIDGSQWCIVAAFKGNVSAPLISLPPNAGLVIVQGYVDENSWLAWPNSPVIEAGTGAGRIRAIHLTNVTGAEWSQSTTSSQRWELLSVQALLNTSAVVANRQTSLVIFDRTGAPMIRFPVTTTQAAALAYGYYWYCGAAHVFTAGTWVTAPLGSGIMLDPGMSVQSKTLNLDAGDQWSVVTLNVKEWLGVSHS